MFIANAYAAEIGSAVAGASPAPAGGSSLLIQFGIFGLIFVAFYFILIRPQQRRMKEQQQMIDSLKKGDRVITAGGLIGKIVKLTNDREAEIELAKDIKVKALRYTLQADIDDTVANAKADAKADEAVKASKE